MKKETFCCLIIFLAFLTNGYSLYSSPKTLKLIKKKTLKSGHGQILQLDFTPDGKELISRKSIYTNAGNKTVYDLWKMGSSRRVKSYNENALSDRYKKLLPPERDYTVDMENNDLIIRKTASKSIVKKLKGSDLETFPWSQPSRYILGNMSPDKKYFFLVTEIEKPHEQLDMTQVLYVLDGKSFSLIKRIESAPHVAGNAVFSPDGKLFAITTFYGVKIFNVKNLEFMDASSVKGEKLAFSNKGRYFATGQCGDYYQGQCSEGGVYVVDAENRFTLLAKQTGKNLGITALTFSPDGKYLAAATTNVDKNFNDVITIILWELK